MNTKIKIENNKKGKIKMINKSRKINEIWKEHEGSKVVWKLQAPKGIITFDTKKKAENFKIAVGYNL